MIRYRGTHPDLPVVFSLARTDYSVAPGETVDIDSKWKPWIESWGLCLEEVPAVVEETAAVAEPETVTEPEEAPAPPPRPRGRPRNS